MSNRLMGGVWRHMIPIPSGLWKKQVAGLAQRTRTSHDSVSQEHRMIHHFVVSQLPYAGEPLSPQFIAAEMALPLERVAEVLEQLERQMTFLFRNDEGAVVWAYPVTVEPTPHHVTFDTGERLYAA